MTVSTSKKDGHNSEFEKEILIEIISGRSLLPGHSNGLSNPYVKVLFGGKVLHKTDYIENTTNPVFSDVKKNSFVFKKTIQQIMRYPIIEVVVKDHSDYSISSDSDLGSALVTISDLYNAKGSDMELKLELPKWKPSVFEMPYAYKVGQDRGEAGYLTIRIRNATIGDKQVIKENKSIMKMLPTLSPMRRSNVERTSVDGLTFADLDEKIILVEILSCRDLFPISGTCNPYVKAILQGNEIHRTDKLKKTTNPKFGKMENNTFILDCSISKLFGSKGIKIMVKDHSLGPTTNEELGSVQISAESLYECKEQEYHLESPSGRNEDAGFVKLRCMEISEKEKIEVKKALRSSILDISMRSSIPELFKSSDRGNIGPTDYSLIVEIVSCQGLRTGKGINDLLNPIGAIGAIGGVAVGGLKAVGDTALGVVNQATKTVGVGSVSMKDPDGIYVTVQQGSKDVHKTDKIPKTECPIYTVRSDGVFILNVSKQDFLDKNEGLTFQVFDWDPVKDKNLGCVTITAEDLINATGDRQDLKLKAPERESIIPNPVGTITGLATGGAKAVGGAALGGVKVVGGGLKSVGKGVGKGMLKITPKPLQGVGKVATKGIGAIGKVAEKGVNTVGKGVKTVGSKAASTAGKVNPVKLLKKHLDNFGTITIRCREATSYDRKFMKFLADQKRDFLGCRQNSEVLFQTKGGAMNLLNVKKLSVTEKSGPDAGVKKYLIRPEPDPHRVNATKYLSSEEIDKEVLKPSREWLDYGSGSIGRIFVEVIKVDGLVESIIGTNDTFALLVFEDAYGKTDIIDNCESPKWMPWSRRAFIFNMDHTSSDLRVGIFKYDKLSNHDLLGRVVVQLNRLNPNTVYTLTYNLYEDSITPERVSKGTVTLRVRVEFDSPKETVLSILKPPNDQYVNFTEERHLRIARNVVEGKTDVLSYSIGTLTLYVGELKSYLSASHYIQEALLSLLLWRGWPPINSMIAFYMAVTFVERPTLCFSYFFFANAWLLLATQNWRNRSKPHVWNRTKPFHSIMMMAIQNKAAESETIPPKLLEKEAIEYDNYWSEKIAKAERLKSEKARLAAAQSQDTAHLDQEGDIDISTKKTNIADVASPFKSILYPLQQNLAKVCIKLRIVRNIYMWDETYIASILTAGSLAIGLVFYILPWGFILRWIGRIVAWGVFGPQMKLVDIFYVRKQIELTEEEEVEKLVEYYRSLSDSANKKAQLARIRTEEAIKIKAMKQLLFGKFLAKVPILKDERFIDIPLPESYAAPYVPPATEPKVLKLGGQALVGTIIPELKHVYKLKEEKGKIKKE